MRNDLPNNEAWISRFKALRDWNKTHRGLPRNHPDGGPEDTLRTWLNRQRVAIAAGELDRNLISILKMVPGAVAAPDAAAPVSAKPVSPPPAPKRVTSRLQKLEDFYREEGRLPKSSAPSAEEQSLYNYLNSNVRVRYRRDELPADAVRRLGAIPGVLVNIRPRPQTDTPAEPTAAALRVQRAEQLLEALVAFLTENQRLPALGKPQPEPRLRTYLYGTLRPAYAAGKLDADAARRLNAALPGCLVASSRPKAQAEGFAA